MLKKLKKIIKRILCINKHIVYKHYGNSSVIQKPYTLIKNKKRINIGDNVYIRKYARIEPVIAWNGIVYDPEIIIEDNVVIEQNLHLTCASSVIIRKNTVISSFVLITDIDHDHKEINTPVLMQPLIIKQTEIGEFCFLGTGVKVMAGVKIGNNCVIGANAVVTHDVSDYCVAVGIPAIVIKKYNSVTKKWESVNNTN